MHRSMQHAHAPWAPHAYSAVPRRVRLEQEASQRVAGKG